ncbi:MAG TPA: DUF190 domain-containing protein [Micropepsaceae bacterium]|nr:DUF190 domain-containing protein [Micropepsaceae bacterium]HRK72483.1 DUF190 domain-containing protein [Micropepsaceae bacterium]
MQRHQRKKLEVTIAESYVGRIADLLERHGVTGFTVLHAWMGRGSGGEWRDTGLTKAEQHVVLSAILSANAADHVMEDLKQFFTLHHGIVTLADVEVIRGERF